MSAMLVPFGELKGKSYAAPPFPCFWWLVLEVFGVLGRQFHASEVFPLPLASLSVHDVFSFLGAPKFPSFERDTGN